jgi:Mg/Co/Ni transporter MgtE
MKSCARISNRACGRLGSAHQIAEYNLLALPVVDDAGDILGIITVDDAMEILLPKDWRQRLPRLFG